MRNIAALIFIVFSFLTYGQGVDYPGERRAAVPLVKRIDFGNLPDISVGIKLLEIHQPHFKSVDHLKSNIRSSGTWQNKKASAVPMPFVNTGFAAQVPSGTPLDNNLAISNDGKIVSVVNTTFRVYDTSGTMLYARSLAAIANQLGTLSRTFDPKIVFDQEANRFILVFLNGSDHTNTSVVAGFSETEDPAGSWNFYKIPGNVGTMEWWSDYPFIGISKNELFISVLLWNDGASGWDSDAVDENIWQISKQDGYDGKPLRQVLYNGVKGNGKQLWNTRPVTGGDRLYGPDFFLLGNRPKDVSNDTFFLLHITGEIDDPGRKLQVSAIVSSLAYGLQPNTTQKGGRRLRTNYCDIHAGFRLEDNLFFVANSRGSSGRAGIYVGRINHLYSNTTAEGMIVAYDSLDLNYPNIAYAGMGWPDISSMVVCLHNSENTYPGTSAFFVDRNFENSDLLRVKNGEGEMNILLGDSLERWGDYTGIHRNFNNAGSVWAAGSFGRASGGTSQTWISHLRNPDAALAVNEKESPISSRVYPNPGRFFQVEFVSPVSEEVSIRVVSADGKVFYQAKQMVEGGKNLLGISLDNINLLPGLLVLEIIQGNRVIMREKLLITP